MRGTVRLPVENSQETQRELIALPEPPRLTQENARGARASSTVRYGKISDASCRAYRFPVRMPGTDEAIELHGELATRLPLDQISCLQVLLAGGSNNGSYWDWPLEPEAHSFVRHATKHGFATLNLDRPGYGKSEHPDPTRTDFASQGDAVRQVVRQLKEGALGHSFKKVVLNGHSMGGMVAWHAASGSDLVDAVIVSGVGHNLSDEAMRYVNANIVPIEEHPSYGLGLPWAPGYFARPISDHPPTDAVDFLTCMLQDTVMAAELFSMVPDSRNAAITRGIRAPVLFALGEKDLRWCTTTGDCRTDPAFLEEAKYYQSDVDFTSCVVPNCGHLTNKDPGAYQFFETVTDWLRRRGF